MVVVDLETGEEQLLGVVPLPDNGTGRSQAAAVLKLLHDRQLEHRVVALVFDTTATNTSPNVGACVY